MGLFLYYFPVVKTKPLERTQYSALHHFRAAEHQDAADNVANERLNLAPARKADRHALEIVLIVRSSGEINRAVRCASEAGVNHVVLDERVNIAPGKAPICTMHLAKGLELKCVLVIACDDEVMPLQTRIESISDESDLEDVYETERHLPYVGCTRARDQLLVTGVDPASEFRDDFSKSG